MLAYQSVSLLLLHLIFCGIIAGCTPHESESDSSSGDGTDSDSDTDTNPDDLPVIDVTGVEAVLNPYGNADLVAVLKVTHKELQSFKRTSIWTILSRLTR